MASRKKEVPELPASFEVASRELYETMRTLHIARIQEMPRIELYLDQVLSIISMELDFIYLPGERVVTGAMINNYVKQRLVPQPVRKRYTRRHLATLLFVCAFKRVLSIAQIAQLFDMARAANLDVERAYDDIATCLEQTIRALFAEGRAEFSLADACHLSLVDSNGNRCPNELEALLDNAVLLLACKVYADRMLALEAMRPEMPELT